MGRRSKSTQEPDTPRSVDAETGIQLLERQMRKAERLLANRPIAASDHTAWKTTTRDYLIRVFGSRSSNINAVVEASSGVRLRARMGAAKSEEHLASLIENQIKMLRSCIEQLQTDIELSEPLYEKDEKTGLLAGGPFKRRLRHELTSVTERDSVASLLFLDIDFFKSINDEWGHPQGDLVLRELGQLLEKAVGKKGTCGRWGGEEFCIILPDFDVEEARATAERIRKSVERNQFSRVDDPEGILSIEVSIGISGFPEPADTMDRLVDQADRAMYAAKKAGRNRVCVYSSELAIEEEATVKIAVEFAGDAQVTNNAKVQLLRWRPKSTLLEILAYEIYDCETGVRSSDEVSLVAQDKVGEGAQIYDVAIEGRATDIIRDADMGTLFFLDVPESKLQECERLLL